MSATTRDGSRPDATFPVSTLENIGTPSGDSMGFAIRLRVADRHPAQLTREPRH